MSTECMAEHTDYDPTIAEFNCPNCDMPCGYGTFGVAQWKGGDVCRKLHVADSLKCDLCYWQGTGADWVRLMRDGVVQTVTALPENIIKAPKPPLKWEFQYAQAMAGPFVLEATMLEDGTGEWKLSVAGGQVSNGKAKSVEDAMRAAENKVREWITEAGKVL